MPTKMGRRTFIGTASLAAAALRVSKSEGGQARGAASAVAQAKKFKKIDVEAHWSPPFPEFNGTRPGARPDSEVGPGQVELFTNFEKRLRIMDDAGVTIQVVATRSRGIQGIPDAKTAITAAKKTNDLLAETILKYPSRLAGFASLPMQDPKASADELDRAVTKLGFKGAMIHGNTDNWDYYDGQAFWPFWERSEALGVPIYLHIADPPDDTKKTLFKGSVTTNYNSWVWAVEAGTHALKIMGSGVFDRFPKATLILGHMGEGIPYLLGRIDGDRKPKTKKTVAEYLKSNVLISTSGTWRPEAMTCAISAMGADRILFATDYAGSSEHAVALVEGCGLSAADKEKIYHLNSEKWLRM